MGLSAKWTSTIDDAITNKAWDDYDKLIKAEIAGYASRFAAMSPSADWKLFKAMVWTESSGPSTAAWKARVMQIGNSGDPGYAVLKKGSEGADLILSDQLKKDIASGSINDPTVNVKAGIAYAYVKLSRTALESVLDVTDTATHEYTVVSGDSFDLISRKVGTTVPALQQLNPQTKVLHAKDVVQYRKAAIKRVLKGWMAFNPKNVAQRYNSGDPNYEAKLNYCLAIMGKLKR
jgi:LysM repeat protein